MSALGGFLLLAHFLNIYNHFLITAFTREFSDGHKFLRNKKMNIKHMNCYLIDLQ